MGHKLLVITTIIALSVTFLLYLLVFSNNSNDYSTYVKLYTMSSSNYNTLMDKSITTKVDDYISKMRSDIANSNTLKSVNYKGSGLDIDGLNIQVDPNSQVGKVIQAAISKVGCPYGWGGDGSQMFSTSSRGYSVWKDSTYDKDSRIGMPTYDCSGLIMASYKEGANISLGHNSLVQVNSGTILGKGLDPSEMKPGDIAGDEEHVVMNLGNGYMIESPETGKAVRIIKIADRWPQYGGKYKPRFWCTRLIND